MACDPSIALPLAQPWQGVQSSSPRAGHAACAASSMHVFMRGGPSLQFKHPTICICDKHVVCTDAVYRKVSEGRRRVVEDRILRWKKKGFYGLWEWGQPGACAPHQPHHPSQLCNKQIAGRSKSPEPIGFFEKPHVATCACQVKPRVAPTTVYVYMYTAAGMAGPGKKQKTAPYAMAS